MSEDIQVMSTEDQASRASRLFSLDVLRGLIMVTMALDHANHFIAHKHSPGEYWGGAFPVYYDSLAFLTRFVTHIAAPGFFLLMGIGMLLFTQSRLKKGWSKWDIIQHFLIRGGILIALQLLLINRVWELSPSGWGINIYIGVLIALGGTMIIGSLLVWLKPVPLLGLAVVLFLGTELVVPDPSQWAPGMSALRLIFLLPGGIIENGNVALWSNYPVLPWLELVILGMVIGHWLSEKPERAFKRALWIGGAFLVAFVLIRYLDGFGNLRPRMGNTWTDFLNPVKYPPSITFTLMTTGINLILLNFFARAEGIVRRLLEPIAVFGRTPLFFYILHLFLYAGLGYWLTPEGTSIPSMYPFWLLGLVILYPLSLWYGRFKHRQPVRSVLRLL